MKKYLFLGARTNYGATVVHEVKSCGMTSTKTSSHLHLHRFDEMVSCGCSKYQISIPSIKGERDRELLHISVSFIPPNINPEIECILDVIF